LERHYRAQKENALAGEPILLIDDHAPTCKLVRLLLEGEGYEVQTASNADAALARLETFRPRMILMDIQLPGMDGLALTRKLKADPVHSGVTIIAFTSYAMRGDEERMLAAGCDGYITKPIDTRRLARRIAGYLSGVTSD
jgi:CheY-like chemotaxis protein